MISVDDYLNHWKVHYGQVSVPLDELTDDMRLQAVVTVQKANELLDVFGQHRDVASGWRPVEVNKLVPSAAPMSNHTRCLAVDLEDAGNDLDRWCLDNLGVLEKIGLWLESPDSTRGWCHVQIVPPHSGRRVFIP